MIIFKPYLFLGFTDLVDRLRYLAAQINVFLYIH